MNIYQPSEDSGPPGRPSGRAARASSPTRAFCGWTSLLVALTGFVWSSGKGDQAHAQPAAQAGKRLLTHDPLTHTPLTHDPRKNRLTLDPVPVSLPILKLPIEVMGANGTAVTVGVQVPPDHAPIAALWMQVHGLTYENKASVRVNGGAWMPLNNRTAAVEEPGKNYGGIGGAFSTLKLSLNFGPPIARLKRVAGTAPGLSPGLGLAPGLNHISFRLNRTDGVSIGFRVLKLQMLTAQGQPVLDPGAFAQDAPSTWQPPLTGDADIAAGESLWRTARLNESSLVSAPVIRATCSDCHAQDGRDLKYFSYSNHSIIERAKFHGLTQTQGEQIASYIRTLKNADGTDVPSPGRPWNPPYQPGPGSDSMPVSAWAAGAGVDAVLDKDTDMVPYLFPNGITKDAIASTQTLNMRELPIALQLIDWNHWLPRVHPKDAWPQAFAAGQMSAQYPALRGYLSAAGDQALAPGALQAQMGYFDALAQKFGEDIVFPNNATGDFTKANLEANDNVALYSVAQWHIVKEWELMQEFGLEGRGTDFYGAKAEGDRQWLTGTSFYSSPAQVRVAGPGQAGTPWADNVTYSYLNNSWYQLQLILNAGNRQRSGNSPVDWGYMPGRTIEMDSSSTHHVDVVRLTSQLIKGMQEQDNGVGPDGNFGFSPNNMSNPWLLGTPFGIGGGDYTDFNAAGWASAPAGTRAQVLTAYLGAYFDLLQRFTPQQYYQENGYGGIAQPDQDPSVYANNLGSSLYMAIPNYRAIGVDGALLNGMCDWAKTIWPKGDWDTLKG